ncbi:MAG: phytoene desaturase family protein [Pelagibacteraceae bacterium]
MNNIKQIVVIGSGFGGIAAALRLKAKGHDVTLIEKQNDLGGRARVFIKDGYTFDAGPTVITAPHLIYELFELFHKDYRDYIKIVPLKIWYQFIFDDLSKLNYGENLNELLQQIEKIHLEDKRGFKNLLTQSEKIFNIGFLKLADKPFHQIWFMLKQIPSLLKLKSYNSVYTFISSYIKNEKLRKAFTIHPLLVGGNPYSTTSIYALILYLERKWGVHYSMGGTGNIIKAFEKLMQEVGIKVIKGQEVLKINHQNKKVNSVVLKNNNQINVDAVVCNADPPKIYDECLYPKIKNNFFNLKMQRLKYSMGLYVFYFGTKKKYENIEHHTIYLGKSHKELLNKIFVSKQLDNDFSYYLHRPSATDSTMAPEGKDCFYVLVPVPNNQSKIDWNEQGEGFKKKIIKKLEETCMPELSKYIEAEIFVTPDYFEKELNTKYGSGFSIEPIFTQSAYFRFHNRSEVLSNLQFVGSGSQPGAGIPGVISSAKVLDHFDI